MPFKRKTFILAMKLTAILLFIACLQVTAKGFSQITLSETNAPLQKIFKEIQKQSGYDFFYPYEIVHEAGPVTVNLRNVSLELAINQVLKGKELGYEILDK